MLHIEVLRGIPASGKSTYARARIAEGWCRVNNDDIRAMLHGGVWSKANEAVVGEVRRSMVKTALNAGQNVVVDNCNAEDYHWREITKIAQEIAADVTVTEVQFPITAEEAMKRDSWRYIHGGVKVGKEVIQKFAAKMKFAAPRVETFAAADSTARPPPPHDPTLPDCVICDLDGTLAVVGDRSPYDASRCDEVDTPNPAVVQTLHLLARGDDPAYWDDPDGYKSAEVVFVSGREDKYEEPTRRFIHKAMYWVKPHYALHMRRSGDYRKDAVVKEEIYNTHIRGKYNVLLVLDDRRQVVDKWRQLGLQCWQVAPGEF